MCGSNRTSAAPSTRSCAGWKSAASSPGWCMGRAPSANEESAAEMLHSPATYSLNKQGPKKPRATALGAFHIYAFHIYVDSPPLSAQTLFEPPS
jgi:hypothetical protein